MDQEIKNRCCTDFGDSDETNTIAASDYGRVANSRSASTALTDGFLKSVFPLMLLNLDY